MLSFVIPARNEAASLFALCEQIEMVCGVHGYEYEIILVDDGSTDQTWCQIETLALATPEVRGIRLRRNFGKGPALTAGFRAARGEVIFTLDADLQDDPNDVPAFLAALEGGLDVVVGWRLVRRDTMFKRLQSKIFNTALGVSGLHLHDHNCGFKAIRSEVLRCIRLYGERHRYLPILAQIDGFKAGEVQVNHRARVHGRSNYGLSRTYRGFFDLMTILFLKGFRHRPMHFLGTLGLGSVSVGFLTLAYLTVLWFLEGHIGNRPLLLYAMTATVFGGQVLATGFLAELVTTYMVRQEDTYAIKDEAFFGKTALAPEKLRGNVQGAVAGPRVLPKPTVRQDAF